MAANGLKIQEEITEEDFEKAKTEDQIPLLFKAILTVSSKVDSLGTDDVRESVKWLTWGYRFIVCAILGLAFFVLRGPMV
jgi:hypothetical protein